MGGSYARVSLGRGDYPVQRRVFRKFWGERYVCFPYRETGLSQGHLLDLDPF